MSISNPCIFSTLDQHFVVVVVVVVFKQGGFQMMIRLDDDDQFTNDLVDRVIDDRQLAVSSSFTSEISVLGYYGRVTMVFRYRVMCQTNYYGSDCTRLCVPQDSDTLGHFNCDANGFPVCLTGYTGQDCLTRESVCVCVLYL